MKKIVLITACVSLLVFNSCKKKNNDETPTVPVSELEVLTDFANVIVNPTYQDLAAKCGLLNQAAITLSTSTTTANLTLAQDAWRAVRVPWELSEAFLFGPVKDFFYDPGTDTWPVNTVELDSLLASNDPLTLADIQALPNSLKGYHPTEYVLFGVGGSKTAAQLTTRELLYLVSLTEYLHNTTSALRNDWAVSSGNFTAQVITAGSGSTRYPTRKDAFTDIAAALGNICREVSESKMQIPLDAHDSTLVESQYAHNATTDFKNNIQGIQNVYLCKFTSSGHSLHDLVAAKDLSLDNALQSQMTTAIASFASINPDYGLAIFTQPNQIQTAQNAINTLHNSLNLLNNFIQTNIKD